MEENIKINSNKDNVSVGLIFNNTISIANIDHIADGRWWISRVNVQGYEKGSGIGSKLLKKAIEEVFKQDALANIIVAPGGYDNETEKQFNFYKKNGFIDSDEKGLLIYKSPNK